MHCAPRGTNWHGSARAPRGPKKKAEAKALIYREKARIGEWRSRSSFVAVVFTSERWDVSRDAMTITLHDAEIGCSTDQRRDGTCGG